MGVRAIYIRAIAVFIATHSGGSFAGATSLSLALKLYLKYKMKILTATLTGLLASCGKHAVSEYSVYRLPPLWLGLITCTLGAHGRG